MKISLKKLRSIIKECLLLEEKCPLCGTDGAYVGLNDVECPNPKCQRFHPSMNPSAKKAKTGTLNFGVWHDKDPRSIDFASLEILSPEAADALAAQWGQMNTNADVRDEVPIWVARKPDDTHEEELKDWLTDEWDSLKVEHEGTEYVLFCGTQDDEYGNIWNPNGPTGEWSSYMY
jgi:hypothetical protein